MNRKEAYAKICDKIDYERTVLAKMIRDAVPGDEFYFGAYKLVLDRVDDTQKKRLYMLSLFKKNSLETKVLADID